MMMMVMIAVPVFAGRKTQHFGVFSVKVYHISVYLQIWKFVYKEYLNVFYNFLESHYS